MATKAVVRLLQQYGKYMVIIHPAAMLVYQILFTEDYKDRYKNVASKYKLLVY